MRFMVRFLAVGFLAAVLSAGNVWAQRNSIEIRGDVHNLITWSVDDVKKELSEEIQTVKHWYEREALTGIPLVSLLKVAELKTEEAFKHHDFSFIVILEAYDGYRAYFTYAELALSAKENPAMLVWAEDGKPLPDRELPFRLLSKDGDRSIFGITRITLVDGNKLINNQK